MTCPICHHELDWLTLESGESYYAACEREDCPTAVEADGKTMGPQDFKFPAVPLSVALADSYSPFEEDAPAKVARVG